MTDEEKGESDYSFIVGAIAGMFFIRLAATRGTHIGAIPTIVTMAICGGVVWGIWQLIMLPAKNRRLEEERRKEERQKEERQKEERQKEERQKEEKRRMEMQRKMESQRWEEKQRKVEIERRKAKERGKNLLSNSKKNDHYDYDAALRREKNKEAGLKMVEQMQGRYQDQQTGLKMVEQMQGHYKIQENMERERRSKDLAKLIINEEKEAAEQGRDPDLEAIVKNWKAL